MGENRYTDLNITAVSTSTAHVDSLNLMSNESHNSTPTGNVIQSHADNTSQHNNNNNNQMNNNHLSQGIKTENQSPPSSNLTVDEQDSSRYIDPKFTYILMGKINALIQCLY